MTIKLSSANLVPQRKTDNHPISELGCEGIRVARLARPPPLELFSRPRMRNKCVRLHSAAMGTSQRPICSREHCVAKLTTYNKKSNARWVGGLSPADARSCRRRRTDILLLASSSSLCRRAIQPPLNPSARSPVTRQSLATKVAQPFQQRRGPRQERFEPLDDLFGVSKP